MSSEATGQRKAKVGVCFSGGGIRSAAFCSGVLHELLGDPKKNKRRVPIDYLSTVSGGGYVGSSFLDWLYWKKKLKPEDKDAWESVHEWKSEYFSHLKDRCGLYIHCRGIAWLIDILTGLVFVTLASVVLLLVQASSLLIPTALVMDMYFGDRLRELDRCGVARARPRLESNETRPTDMPLHGCFFNSKKMAFEGLCILVVLSMGFFVKTLSWITYFLFKDDGCVDPKKLRLTPLQRKIRVFSITMLPMLQALALFFMYHYMLAFLVLLYEDFNDLLDTSTRLQSSTFVVQVAVMLAVGMIWAGMPLSPFRDKVSTAVTVAFIGYVAQLWIFRNEKKRESDRNDAASIHYWFFVCTTLASLALLFMNWIGMMKFHLLYFYNRSRLTRFYYHWAPKSKKEKPWSTWDTIQAYCYPIKPNDVYPGKDRSDDDREVFLSDLTSTGTEYSASVVANRWSIGIDDVRENDFKLVELSSTGVHVFHPNMKSVKPKGIKVEPENVKLMDAMTMSAAAVSLQAGKYSRVFKSIESLQHVFGLSLGKSMPNQFKHDFPDSILRILWLYIISSLNMFRQLLEKHIKGPAGIYQQITDWLDAQVGSFSMKLLLDMQPYLYLMYYHVLILALPLCYEGFNLYTMRESSEYKPSKLFLVMITGWWLIVAVSLVPAGFTIKKKEERTLFFIMKWSKWVNINSLVSRYTRTFYEVMTAGPWAPFSFYFSDGGHVENLGLLPILNKRPKYIIICDGGYYGSPMLVSTELMSALEMARQWLGCSFTSCARNGEDLDIKHDGERDIARHIEKILPYNYGYRFRVHYPPDEDGKTEHGNILILQPRHPETVLQRDGTHQSSDGDLDVEDANNLTGLCLDRLSCTSAPLKWLSHKVLGRFPYFHTFFQLITPNMFNALHENGKTAAQSEEAQAFFKDCRPPEK